ncbi:MAG: DUF3368 domain-containing protein [Treponema sp.]|nr:DUF3368 domain-containing protein [Treponema sp.]
MIVVSDTTPLISLLKIGRIDLFERLFSTVHIPQGVFDELCANQNFLDEAEQIRDCPFIHIHDVNAQAVKLLQKATKLDLGESEAIVLADTINADLTILDDGKARRVAELEGMAITGTIGVLGKAFKSGFISSDEIKQCVEILRTNGRYFSENLLKYLLDLASRS